ncbi:MAG TPA: hypothetical protein VK991_12685 [Halomonas sp.]|nr:hypothetical protein [Halomonas sp.]
MHDAASRSEDPVSLSDKLAFLDGLFHGAERIETHSAFVYLTAERAFKIKKPVRLPFLDHRRLAARERACREELRLNRQLAGADVYLGLDALVLRANGALALGGEGRVVDWLVRMRRLPADRMLDTMLKSGRIPARRDIAAVANRLVAFYRQRRADPPRPGVYLTHILKESEINARHLYHLREHLDGADIAGLAAQARTLIARHTAEIEDREAARLIVEGHGDLRPEHVCLTAPPVLFDRIEFATEMLMIDIFDETNYLGLECALLGAAWVGPMIMDALRAAGFAAPSDGLMRTYGAFRCMTRARLSIDHLLDRHPRTPAKWPLQARAYLAHAAEMMNTE